MAQYARPDSDVTVSGFTSTPLYSKVNETSANDSPYISGTGVDTCELGLSDVSDPGISTGHILRVRSQRGSGGASGTAYLYVGGTQVCSLAMTLGASFATDTHTLSSGEVAIITAFGDYSSLRVRLSATTAGKPINVSWVELEVPDVAGTNYQPVPDVAVASATPDTVALDAARNISSSAFAASSTIDTALLSVARNIELSTSASSATNDSVVLDVTINFLAGVSASSVTPDTVLLNSVHDISPAISIASSTIDTAILNIVHDISSAIASASVTPDTVTLVTSAESWMDLAKTLAVGVPFPLVLPFPETISSVQQAFLAQGYYIEFTGTAYTFDPAVSGSSVTPDTSSLSIARSASVAIGAASVTPDTSSLGIARNISAAIGVTSLTSDTSSLGIARNISAATSAASATPDISSLGIARNISAATSAASATPDTVTLDVSDAITFAPSTAVTSSTPDITALDVARNVTATSSVASVTSDTSTLSIARTISASIPTASATPDTVTLDVSDAITFAPSVSVTSSTPDITALDVARNVAATLSAVSTTSAASSLSIARTISASISTASATPDTVTLDVSDAITFAPSVAAASVAQDSAALSVSREISAAISATSSSNDVAVLAIGRNIGVSVVVLSATPDTVSLETWKSIGADVVTASTTQDAATLSVNRGIQASIPATSVTPDDVVLSVSSAVTFSPSVDVLSSTQDNAALAVSRDISADIICASVAQDAAAISISRNISSFISAASATPDTVSLDIVSDISFAPSIAVTSLTTSDVLLSVARQISSSISSFSNTSNDTILSLASEIVFIDSAVTYVYAASSITITLPSYSEGDLLIAFVSRGGNGAAETWDDDGGGGNGWTQLITNYTSTGRAVESAIFYKVATTSESNPTFTHGGSYALAGSISVFGNVDGTTPFDVTYNNSSHFLFSENSYNPTPKPVTTVTDGSLVFAASHITYADITAIGTISGYDLRVSQVGSNVNMMVATKTVAAAGTETPGAWTNTSGLSDSECHTYTLALRVAEEVTPPTDHASISFIGQSNNSNYGSSLTIEMPSYGQNDLLIAFVMRGGNGAQETWDDDGGGGNGWTRIVSNYTYVGRDVESALYYKIAGTDEPDPTFTHGGSYTLAGSIVSFRDVDMSSPLDVTYSNSGHYIMTEDESSPTPPSITTVTDGAYAIVMAGITHPDITAIGAPTGYSLLSDLVRANGNVMVAAKEIATAGAETPGAWSNTSALDECESHGYTLAIRPRVLASGNIIPIIVYHQMLQGIR